MKKKKKKKMFLLMLCSVLYFIATIGVMVEVIMMHRL